MKEVFKLNQLQVDVINPIRDNSYQRFEDNNPQCMKDDASIWPSHKISEGIKALCEMMKECFKDGQSTAFKAATMVCHKMHKMNVPNIDFSFDFERTKENITQENVQIHIEQKQKGSFNSMIDSFLKAPAVLSKVETEFNAKGQKFDHFWNQSLPVQLIFKTIYEQVKAANPQAKGDDVLGLVASLIFVADWMSEKNLSESSILFNGLMKESTSPDSAEGKALKSKQFIWKSNIAFKEHKNVKKMTP